MHANKALHSGSPSVPFCSSLSGSGRGRRGSRQSTMAGRSESSSEDASGSVFGALSCSQSVRDAAGMLLTSWGKQSREQPEAPRTCSDLKSLEIYQREKFPPNQKKRKYHTSGCSRFVFKLVKKEKKRQKKSTKLMRKSEERKKKGGQKLRNTALVVTCSTVSEDLPPQRQRALIRNIKNCWSHIFTTGCSRKKKKEKKSRAQS